MTINLDFSRNYKFPISSNCSSIKLTNYKIIKICFAILVFVWIFVFCICSVQATSENTVLNRLTELYTLNGKYFTTTGEACNTSREQKHECIKCSVDNVISINSVFRSKSGLTKWPTSFSMYHARYNSTSPFTYVTPGSSCVGFANFVGWYLFSDSASSKVSYSRFIDCQLKEVYKYAKPGDLIATSGHSAVYLSGSSRSIHVLDCNWTNAPQCKIQIRDWTAGTSMVSISRSDSYELSDQDSFSQIGQATGPEGQEYFLFAGRCSWNEANTYVESHYGTSGHLVTINSLEEQNIVNTLVSKWNNRGHGGMAWIGAHYINGNWQWVTGEQYGNYSNWANTGSSTNQYGAIIGQTGLSNHISYTAGKWYARSSILQWAMPGFIVEYEPKLEGKNYVTLSVNDIYNPLSTIKGGVGKLSMNIISGENSILQIDQEYGYPYITAIHEGSALIQISDESGQNKDLAVTVLPYTCYMSINSDDEEYGTTITSDCDRKFILQYLGPGTNQTITKSIWSSSDCSILKIISQAENNQTCVVRAMSNGTAILHVELEIDMGNPFYDYSETWEADIELTAIVPASGTINCIIPNSTLEEKLQYLRQVFPDGWFFNSWPDNSLGTNDIQYRILIDGQIKESNNGRNKLGVSNRPCPINSNHQYCSHYWGNYGGSKSIGYARMMMYLLSGKDMESSAFMIPYDPVANNFDFLLSALPGDIIAAGSDRYYIVQARNNDQFVVTDCNYDGQCSIRWDAVYTLDDFRNQILAYPLSSGVYIGRLYMPNYRQMPTGSIVRYEVISDNGLELRSQPYTSNSDSVKWGSIPKGTIILVDRKYTFSRNAGWALCKTEDGTYYGWAQVDDVSLCKMIDDGYDLTVHHDIYLPNGYYNINKFKEWLHQNNTNICFGGDFSGMISNIQFIIRAANPCSHELGDPIMMWGLSYDSGDNRISVNLSDEVSFTDNMIDALVPGAYRAQLIVQYYKGKGMLDIWSSEEFFWLVPEETQIMPDQIEFDQVSGMSTLYAPVIRVTFRDEPINALYYSIQTTEGSEIADIEFEDCGNGMEYYINFIRKSEGTLSFILSVIDKNYNILSKPFTIVFEHCNHNNLQLCHSNPCTEAGWWILDCKDCGQIIDQGQDALNAHTWVIDYCAPATQASNGEIGDIHCCNCFAYLSEAKQQLPHDSILFLPDHLQTIESQAFIECNAIQITLPNHLERIESQAFAHCNQLHLVVFPDSVTYIADDIFEQSNPIIYCSEQNTYVINWAHDHNLLTYTY